MAIGAHPSVHPVVVQEWERSIRWGGADDKDGDGRDSLFPVNVALDAIDLNGGGDVLWDGADGDVSAAVARSDAAAVKAINEERAAARRIAAAAALPKSEAPLEPAAEEKAVDEDEKKMLIPAPTFSNPYRVARPMAFHLTRAFRDRYMREVTSISAGMPLLSSSAMPGAPGGPTDEHMAHLIEMKEAKRKKMEQAKQARVTGAMDTLDLRGGRGRNITSSLMGPGGTERTGRPLKYSGHSGHEHTVVEQPDVVVNHVLVRPGLRKSELRQFRRPRISGDLCRPSRHFVFLVRIAPAAGRAGSKGAPQGADGKPHAAVAGMAPTPAATRIRTENDLNPADASHFTLLEYSEERPPLMLCRGMAVRIINYYKGDRARCPISAGGGDRPTRSSASKKAERAKKAGADAAAGGADARARRALGLIGPRAQGAVKATDFLGKMKDPERKEEGDAAEAEAQAKAKAADEQAEEEKITVLPEGTTEALHPKSNGPFLGRVEEGTTQTGLMSNVFVAPMFRHPPYKGDFLMIFMRRAINPVNTGFDKMGVDREIVNARETTTQLLLRHMPQNIFTVGQTEPRQKAFAPNTKSEKEFQVPFFAYQIAKRLAFLDQRDGRGMKFDEIKDRLFENTDILHNALRARIREVAVYDKNTQIWTQRKINDDGYPGVDALGRRFHPEGVAANESSSAGAMRLVDLGISKLQMGSSSVANVGSALIYLHGQHMAAKERMKDMSKQAKMIAGAATAAARSVGKGGGSGTAPDPTNYEKAAEKLEIKWKEAKRKYDISLYIYEELLLAPWHITGEFIECHKNGQGSAMMKLTGLGDPSGRGEAFNFLREQDNKPAKSLPGSSSMDATLAARIKKITGTDNDLRKLNMKQMASMLRSYGLEQKQIDHLKRWDRVHVIRDLSTRTASDGVGDGMERFARGEKMKLFEQRQMYTDRIQEIWRRQIQALSTDPGYDVFPAVKAAPKTDDEEAVIEEEEEEEDDEEEEDFADLLDNVEMGEMEANKYRDKNGGLYKASDDLAGMSEQDRAANEASKKDARDLANWRRQQEEEKAAQKGLSDDSPTMVAGENYYGDRKVIRRRKTVTHPDGRQTVTFQFIVQPDEVERVIYDKREERRIEKLEKKKRGGGDNKPNFKDSIDGIPVGHAIFEEEDDGYNNRGPATAKLRLRTTRKSVGMQKMKTIRKGPGTGMTFQKRKNMSNIKDTAIKKRLSDTARKVKKREREAEEADIYAPAASRRGTSNRAERGAARDRMPHVIFSDRLETIRSEVERRPASGPFHRPVSKQFFPKYYDIIEHPIDLQTIRDKIARYDYKYVADFLKDFELMKNNAMKFNGEGHPLAKEAAEIYDSIDLAIENRREEFLIEEQAVQKQQLSRPGKKNMSRGRAGQKKGGSSSKAGTGKSSGETAKLVVDGVTRTLNLGNLSGRFKFGDGSDSDGGNG